MAARKKNDSEAARQKDFYDFYQQINELDQNNVGFEQFLWETGLVDEDTLDDMTEQAANERTEKSMLENMEKWQSGQFKDPDNWEYGDGDQSMISGLESQIVRAIWTEGGDYDPTTSGITFLSAWALDCFHGRLDKVKRHLEKQPRLLDRRESLLRFNGILHVIAGSIITMGKTDGGRSTHFECVKFLIEKGTPVDSKDLAGHTPLHHCTGVVGNTSTLNIADYLISKGADVNMKNRHGCTPIFEPVQRLNEECFDWLLEHGASVKVVDNDGTSFMQIVHLQPSLRKKFSAYISQKCKEEKKIAKEQGLHHTCAVCGNKNHCKRCTGCFLAWYCGADCQKAAWKEHKADCKKAQSEYVAVHLEQDEHMSNINWQSQSCEVFTPLGLDKLTGRSHFIVKVQVAMDMSDDKDLMIYNKEKSLYGSITPRDAKYRVILDTVHKKGVSGCKGYFYAIWQAEKGLKINVSRIQPPETW